jgi:hypothetical protein
MALLSKLRGEDREPDSQMWKWLVAYANSDNSHKDFRYLVRAGFQRMGVAEGVTKILRECKDMKSGLSMQQLEKNYRKPIHDVLSWIVRPTAPTDFDSEIDLRFGQDTGSASFLVKCAQSAEMNILTEVTIDGEGKVQIEHKRAYAKSDTIIAGVCQYILRQIDRHDLDGEALTDVFPITLCGRQECGRFLVVQRTGRSHFCCDACRAKFHASKRTKEENAEKMRRYRALQKERDAANLAIAMSRSTSLMKKARVK